MSLNIHFGFRSDSRNLMTFAQTVVEADADTGEMHGTVSMSAQFAPYDAKFRECTFSPTVLNRNLTLLFNRC